MMRLLLAGRADPRLTTQNQTTAVMFAAGPTGGGLGGSFPVSDADRIDAIELALDRGVDVNALDATGQTALHVAAGQSSAPIVTALVERGAKLDIKDKQGRTPLDVARGVGARGQPVVRADVVEALQRGAKTAGATVHSSQ
jgi:ankyrin repeat protein